MHAKTVEKRTIRPSETQRIDVTDVSTWDVAEFVRSNLEGADVRFERRPGRTHLVAEADR